MYATLRTCHSVWMTVWYAGCTLHTRQSSTQSDKYQVSHRYSYFSWWWAHSRPKHVEKINKHIKKNCAPSWLYLQDCNILCLVTNKNLGKLHDKQTSKIYRMTIDREQIPCNMIEELNLHKRRVDKPQSRNTQTFKITLNYTVGKHNTIIFNRLNAPHIYRIISRFFVSGWP